MVNAFAAKRGLTASLDWFFGPVAFLSDKAPHWLEYQGTAWDAQMVWSQVLRVVLVAVVAVRAFWGVCFRETAFKRAQWPGTTHMRPRHCSTTGLGAAHEPLNPFEEHRPHSPKSLSDT